MIGIGGVTKAEKQGDDETEDAAAGESCNELVESGHVEPHRLH
jgi:hypothetical protein